MFPSRIVSVLGGGVGLQNNYSLVFDGSNDYVAIAANANLYINDNDYSLSFWFKTNSSEDDYMVGGGDESDNGFIAVRMRGDYSGVIRTFIRDCSNSKEVSLNTTTTGLNDNSWHHYLCTFTWSSKTLTVYIDGSSEGTSTNATIVSLANSDDGIHIGKRYASTYYYVGNIDEVSIWNKVLSAGDISALYQARGTSNLNDDGNSANLQGWWRMGDGTLDDGNIAGNGLIADQSAPSALGRELLVTTGWTLESMWTLSGGVLTFDDSGNGGAKLVAANMTNGTGMAIGKVYKLQYTISNLSSGTADIRIDNEDGNLQIAEASEANGSYTKYFVATHDGKGLRFVALAAGDGSFDISSYSLKQVTGNPGVMVNFDGSDIVTDTP